MKKQFLFLWYGFLAALNIADFPRAIITLFTFITLNATSTYYIYSDWPFSFFRDDGAEMFRLLFAFFGGTLVWGVITLSIVLVLLSFIDFFTTAIKIRALGMEKYYKVFDILKEGKDDLG